MKTMLTLGVAVVFGLVRAPAAHADRTVQVTFACRGPSGAPLADVPISGRSFVGPWGCTTDDEGTAVIKITLRDDERSIRYSLLPKEPEAHGDNRVETIAGVMRAMELADSFFIRRNEILALRPEQSQYSVQIALRPARKVRFQCVDANGTALEPLVYGPGATHEQEFIHDGNVVVSGVPSDEACILMIDVDSDILEIPIPSGSGDLELGNVTLRPAPHDATMLVHLSNVDNIDHRGYEESGFVFLVSVDGQRLLNYTTFGYKTTAEFDSANPATLPAGEYWISPFEWSDTGPSGALLKLVRSGVDLADSGIPKLVVAPGGHTELQVDVAAAQKAILERAVAAGLWPEY